MPSSLFTSLFSLALIATTVSGLPAGSCESVAPAAAQNGKAIYIITNDKANQVLALPIGVNGMLSAGTCTGTGGAGSNSIDSTSQPAAPDALVSQSALTVAGNHLFAVNAGSNTVTMFAINPRDATKLTMVGKPVPVTGEFPNTVAASEKNKLVCVGSSGAKAGVSCSSFSAQGMGAMDALRTFDLKQSTPPSGPLNTVSQVFFAGDESKLFTTVKGDPTKNNTGFLATFPVGGSNFHARHHGGAKNTVSQQGVRSSPDGTVVLFGSSVIPGSSDIFVTDASFGGAVLSVGNNTATVKGKAAVDGQKATCWVAVSPASKTAFVTDVGTNRLVEMSLTDASIIGQIDLTANGDPGLIDLRAAGNFVYALSPGNGTTQAAVTVVDALTKKQVQHLSLQGMGAGKNSQGMAVLL